MGLNSKNSGTSGMIGDLLHGKVSKIFCQRQQKCRKTCEIRFFSQLKLP